MHADWSSPRHQGAGHDGSRASSGFARIQRAATVIVGLHAPFAVTTQGSQSRFSGESDRSNGSGVVPVRIGNRTTVSGWTVHNDITGGPCSIGVTGVVAPGDRTHRQAPVDC